MPTSSQDEAAPVANEAASSSTPPRKGPGRDPQLVSRDELMARMDEKIANLRKEEDAEFLRQADVNPAAAALAAAMAREARGEPIATDKGHRDMETPAEEGVESVIPIAEEEAPAARPAQRVSQKGTDPLGDFVVRVEGKPMFKTVVDGKETLIPLDRARAQLQKHLAADIRLQQAAERQRALDAREAAIRQTEQTLTARNRPPAPAVDDKALDTEAVELVRSLVNEPEDKAAARLARTLKTIRSTTPAVDAAAIAKEAAAEAMRTIAARDSERALQSGFQQFTRDYPDIAADSDLFNLADKKSEVIAAEHPDWSPGEIMMEAGKQTREWLRSIGARVPGAPPASEQPNNRQQRKQTLVPMPRPTTARAPAPSEEGAAQSPQELMAEIRKARGQQY